MTSSTPKGALILVLLLGVAVVVPVSGVSTKLNLEPNATTGLWELKWDDYRNLENGGNAHAALPAGIESLLPSRDFNYSSYTFLKLMVTAPRSINEKCDGDLSNWFKTLKLEAPGPGAKKVTTTGKIPNCVGATLSTAGIIGSWTNPRMTVASGNKKVKTVNPITVNVSVLVGGNATVHGANSMRAKEVGSGNVGPIHVLSKWTSGRNTDNLYKMSWEAAVKTDDIMLLLDVLTIETVNATSFKNYQQPLLKVKDQLKWKPNHAHVIQESIVNVEQLKPPKRTSTVTITVLKRVYPMKQKTNPTVSTTKPTTTTSTTKAPSSTSTTSKTTTTTSTTRPTTTTSTGKPKLEFGSRGFIVSNTLPHHLPHYPGFHFQHLSENKVQTTPAPAYGWVVLPPKPRNSSVSQNATNTTSTTMPPPRLVSTTRGPQLLDIIRKAINEVRNVTSTTVPPRLFVSSPIHGPVSHGIRKVSNGTRNETTTSKTSTEKYVEGRGHEIIFLTQIVAHPHHPANVHVHVYSSSNNGQDELTDKPGKFTILLAACFATLLFVIFT